jgi:FlaA1/EpsC-like NDP-sugar epimerase
MIRLAGREPYKDIDLVITGCREGEKLSEDLVGTNETARPTPHEKLRILEGPRPTLAEIERWLEHAEVHVRRFDSFGAVHHIKSLIPEYQPDARWSVPRKKGPEVDTKFLGDEASRAVHGRG